MATSLTASEVGIQLVDQARRRKRWLKTSPAWYNSAFTSKATLNRFWARQPIRRDTFIAICQVVGVPWEEIAAQENAEDLFPCIYPNGRQDLGDAPSTDVFFGRKQELSILKQWVVNDSCRIVAVQGMGGIGKSTLTAKFARQVYPHFEAIIWRSLRNAPSIQDMLTELIQFLSQQQESALPDHLDGKIVKLASYLQSSRCLLILDNPESILVGGARANHYREGYEGYRELFRCIGEMDHTSCLLLTFPRNSISDQSTKRQKFTRPLFTAQGTEPVRGERPLWAKRNLCW